MGTLWKLGNLLSTGGAPVGMRPSYLRSAKRGRRERTRQKEQAVMAAHQMPTTASGMPHPSVVMASQYAHSQPQVLPNFYLAQNGPETTKFGQEMRYCGGGEEASEKR